MRLATPAQSEWEGWGESTAVIVAMGLALAVAGIVQTLETPVSQPVVAFELFVSLLVPTGLATGGYWLASRDISPDVRWRAATRVSIGIVVACALGVWLIGYVTLEGGTIRDPLSLVTVLAAVGGATGFASVVREPLRNESSSMCDCAVDGDTAAAPSPTAAAADTKSTAGESTAATTETTAPTDERISDAMEATDETATSRASTATTASASTTTEATSRAGVSPDADIAAGPDDPTHRVDSTGDPKSEEPDAPPLPARDPGIDTVATVPSTAETVLDVLQNERARVALAVLYHEWNGEPRAVDALARAVASHTDDSADAVAAVLRHTTLPKLAAIRAIDWDPHTDLVSESDHAVFEEGVREASVLLEAFEPGTR
ncbi:hypothetical protein CP556_16505 [Natrinema sp. CBA1119]|uniref:DUF7344 domain-containing protein n=1 Tax=Natrinema sp. CBA1119 TaxID=1608465 RepID=UPI000BF64A5B|nr:hypothetical protein [Natrinema sp. CBA1119]PGF17543.1 hypothetical protein CP556_16505 [Natrinema sp. CBA1119]